MTRKSNVLINRNSNTNVVLLERRLKGNTKKYDMGLDKKVTINMHHFSCDIEESNFQKFKDRVKEEYGYIDKKTNVVRVLFCAYAYGFLNIPELEAKLATIKEDVFL